jgi:hypothetical protein
MNQKPTTHFNFLTQHPAKKKKRTSLKGAIVKEFRGRPTSTYLEQQKRIEEFKKTINGWSGEK